MPAELRNRYDFVYHLYWQTTKKEEGPKPLLLPSCGIVFVVRTNTKRGGKMNITGNLDFDKRELEHPRRESSCRSASLARDNCNATTRISPGIILPINT